MYDVFGCLPALDMVRHSRQRSEQELLRPDSLVLFCFRPYRRY